MKKRNRLFDLVKSLSQTEKRYFKVFASRHVLGSQNNYEQLFNAIEKQSRVPSGEYNEAALKKGLKTFTSRFSATKSYLYSLILKSLDAYNGENTVDRKIQKRLNYIEILFEKGLFEQCEFVLLNAAKLINKHEKYFFLMESLQWKIQLILAKKSSVHTTENEIQKAHTGIFGALGKIKNINEHHLLSYQLFLKMERNDTANKYTEKKQIRRGKLPILLSRSGKTLSVRAMMLSNLSNMYYFSLQNNLLKAYHYSAKCVDIFEAHPFLITESTRTYISALSNLINYQMFHKKYEGVLPVIDKIKSIRTRSERLNNAVMSSAVIRELDLYNITGEFHKGIILIKSLIKSDKEDYILEKKHEKLFYYSMAYTYFGAEDLRASKKILNKTITKFKAEEKNTVSELYYSCMILEIIVNYELGNEDIVEYLTQSIYRRMKKRTSRSKLEQLFIDFMRNKVPKADSSEKRVKLFKKFKLDIENLPKDFKKGNTLAVFDFTSWIESKIEKKSFAEIVKRKVPAQANL